MLAATSVCGSGLAPFTGLVKLIAFTWRKTLSPTTTVTGTVTLPAADWKISSPAKVPGARPPPGRLGTDTPIETREGVAPLRAEMVSQLPPSAVIPVAVQSNIPDDPPFLISIS